MALGAALIASGAIGAAPLVAAAQTPASIRSAVEGSADARSFTDVPASHRFFADISWLAERGITTGNADGSFAPKRAVTREAMAAFLHRYDTRFGE
ncbi:MAG: S-layer homology domain-containing protein [Leucobacter sp.]